VALVRIDQYCILVEGGKRSVVISNVIRLPGSLLDHDPFGIARAGSYFGVDVILPISTSWQALLTVLKVAPSDVSRKRGAAALLQQLEQVASFLKSRCERRGVLCPHQWAERDSVRESIANVGCDAWERPCYTGQAQ
jgi:hypothetical protein